MVLLSPLEAFLYKLSALKLTFALKHSAALRFVSYQYSWSCTTYLSSTCFKVCIDIWRSFCIFTAFACTMSTDITNLCYHLRGLLLCRESILQKCRKIHIMLQNAFLFCLFAVVVKSYLKHNLTFTETNGYFLLWVLNNNNRNENVLTDRPNIQCY